MEARRAEAELERRRADALLTACDLGLTDDVAALIAGGATFEATDKAGVRPMTFAAARGHADVVELLCSHGVDANDDDALGRAPLHFAAMHGRARVVRALASRPGTWVDPPDHLDDTPLTLAARMADAETIAALLDAGADARARNKAGLTPLGEALLVRRRFDLADLLLEHEAGRQTDALRENGSRDDAARLETKKKAFVEVLETTTAGPGGWSLVVAAAAFGAEDTLAWLRDKGVDVDAVLAAGEVGTKRSANASDASKPAPNATNERDGVSGFSVSGFAALSADARLRTARGWAATPVERRSAPGSGVPREALPALEVRDALVREVEKRDFLQKLVDDDEFQEDMALSHTRDAVDAVVRDFNAVARFTGDARVMRVLEKFRVVQRFCKARGFKITFADVRVADAAEAEARRRKVGELRERADAALAAACRAALESAAGFSANAAEIEGGAGIEQPRSTAVSKQASKPLSLGNVLGHVVAQPTVLSLVAAIVALCVAPRVSALARRAFGRGWFFFEGDGDDS